MSLSIHNGTTRTASQGEYAHDGTSWVPLQRVFERKLVPTNPLEPVSGTNPLIEKWVHLMWFVPPTQTPSSVSGSNTENSTTEDFLRAFWTAQTTDPTNTFDVYIEWERFDGGAWYVFETATQPATQDSVLEVGDYDFAAQEVARVRACYTNEAGAGPWSAYSEFLTNFRTN